ncbi:MAG: DUF4417 domain-containing protein [Rickettsiaceae bacterium]|nr:DUF4417 domain-containing protein [Rickettsiaceae bacterium]
MSNACTNCCFLEECGGPVQNELWGCHEYCINRCDKNCQFVCSAKLREFVRRQHEVASNKLELLEKLSVPKKMDLPVYIPKISTNGYALDRRMDTNFVAISLYDLFVYDGNHQYVPKFKNRFEIREKSKIKDEAKILIVSNNKDRYLERFWKYHDQANILNSLNAIDVWGIVVPNYSFFLNAPRTHAIYSRKRAERIMNVFSKAGLPIIPHIQASVLYPKDWSYWTDVIRRFEEIRYISVEFGTGWNNQEFATLAVEKLKKLTIDVDRPLSLFAIGARDVIYALSSYFQEATLVNHTPYFKSIKRRRLCTETKWVRVNTPKGAPISDLLDYNISEYSKYIKEKNNITILEQYQDADAMDCNDEALPLAQNF